MTKLDRLARSLSDARANADELTTRQISLSLGGSVFDPTDAVARLLFIVLAMVAEFESDLVQATCMLGIAAYRCNPGEGVAAPRMSRRDM